MSTNRHTLQNSEIVKFSESLEKGLPIFFLEKKLTVEDGWVAVMTVGGSYQETLAAGTHFLGKYKINRELKSTLVDIRIKTLNVITDREFSISQPVPVEVNIDLAVEYRVVDARRVALEMTTPLTSLFDRVLQALRDGVVNATLDEIRRQGGGIAQAVQHHLQAMKLPQTLGMEVLNVMTTRIKATDTGGDALATRQLEWWTRMQDAVVNGNIYQHINVTPQYLMLTQPDLYAKLNAGHVEVLKELIDKGMLDPSGVMNQPTRSTGGNMMDMTNLLLGGLTGMGIQNGPTQPTGYAGQPSSPSPQITSGGAGASSAKDIHARMEEEIRYLEQVPGVKVEVSPGVNGRGIADGSYNLRVSFKSSSYAAQYVLYITCPPGYPQSTPSIELAQNEEEVSFQSTVLRRWAGQWLVEIVREVRQYFS